MSNIEFHYNCPTYQSINQFSFQQHYSYTNQPFFKLDQTSYNQLIQPNRPNTTKYKAKTSLCKNWAQTGSCPYNYKCQFAHGLEQLRCNVSENSYKTKPCNSFFKNGFCPYGHRCNFSHKENKAFSDSLKLEDKPQIPQIIHHNLILMEVKMATRYGSRVLQLIGLTTQEPEDKSIGSTEDCRSENLSKSRVNLTYQKLIRQDMARFHETGINQIGEESKAVDKIVFEENRQVVYNFTVFSEKDF